MHQYTRYLLLSSFIACIEHASITNRLGNIVIGSYTYSHAVQWRLKGASRHNMYKILKHIAGHST